MRNLDKTHWGRRINRAEKNGEFTLKDKKDSESWVTCACGRHDPRLQKEDKTRGPRDVQLSDLGARFAGTVSINNFDGSRSVLTMIEERATYLLRELRKNERPK